MDTATMASGEAAGKTFQVKRLIADLPGHLIPHCTESANTASSPGPTKLPARRLVIVGDVHGMRNTLQALLDKVKFDKSEGDHLILVGDLVNKGPDSPGVVDMAIRLGASAVRGNHDNAVLLAAAELKAELHQPVSAGATSEDSTDSSSGSSCVKLHGNSQADQTCKNVHSAPLDNRVTATSGNSTSYITAARLSPAQLDWLASLPLILRVGLPPNNTSLGRLVIVHAGLVPGVPLEQQDPHSIMHMRSLVRTADGGQMPMEAAGAEGWAATWDHWQETCQVPTTVVFGHDAKRGLQQGKFSIGLDSACVYGHQLSALLIVATENGVESHLVQVDCADPIVTEGGKAEDIAQQCS